MRSRIAAGSLFLVAMLALLLRWALHGPTGVEERDAKGIRMESNGEKLANSEPSANGAKASERGLLRDMLPLGVKIEADEMRGTIAKGNVRLALPQDVEVWADQVQVSARNSAFIAAGHVMIWSKGRTTCLAVRGAPVKWQKEGDTLKVESLEGVEMVNFKEPQSEEKMRELQMLPSLLELGGKEAGAEE